MEKFTKISIVSIDNNIYLPNEAKWSNWEGEWENVCATDEADLLDSLMASMENNSIDPTVVVDEQKILSNMKNVLKQCAILLNKLRPNY